MNADIRELRVEVVDPLGFHHVVLFDRTGTYGWDNLAHAWPEDAPELRHKVTDELLSAIARGDKDLPHGFHRSA
jgi:hypothetical protein